MWIYYYLILFRGNVLASSGGYLKQYETLALCVAYIFYSPACLYLPEVTIQGLLYNAKMYGALD